MSDLTSFETFPIVVAPPNILLPELDVNNDRSISGFILGSMLYQEHPEDYQEQVPLLDTQTEEQNKLSELKAAVKHDFAASENKLATAGWASGMIVGQAFDRFRGSVILTPLLATTVMEHTHNSTLTGVVAAGTFFVVNKLIGESLNYGLEEFPRSVEAFNESFPGLVGAFTDSLAGVEDKETNELKRQQETGQPSSVEQLHSKIEQIKVEVRSEDTKTLLEKSKIIGKHVVNLAKTTIGLLKTNAAVNRKRALTCIGIGPTPFVATAAANGYTRKERSKVANATVGATSGLVGVLGFGLSESVIQLANHGHQEAALDIQNVVSSSWLWLSLAAMSMGSEFISKRLEKRRESSKDAK